MNKRFELILKEMKGEILHLGSTNSDNFGNLNDTLSASHKIYSCDISGNPDYKIDLNSKQWKIDKKFDTVIAGEIIEHVGDPIGFLTNCYDLLNDGGKLILTTPNATSISYLVNPYWCVGDGKEIWHIHCFTSGMIMSMLNIVGFKNSIIRYENYYTKNILSKLIGFIFPRIRGGLFTVAIK
jgi:SAM-dependent methyltransferase